MSLHPANIIYIWILGKNINKETLLLTIYFLSYDAFPTIFQNLKSNKEYYI